MDTNETHILHFTNWSSECGSPHSTPLVYVDNIRDVLKQIGIERIPLVAELGSNSIHYESYDDLSMLKKLEDR